MKETKKVCQCVRESKVKELSSVVGSKSKNQSVANTHIHGISSRLEVFNTLALVMLPCVVIIAPTGLSFGHFLSRTD